MVGRVTIENGEMVIRGYDSYFTKEEETNIMMNVINNYPKHQIGDGFHDYLEGLRSTIQSALDSRALSKNENRRSWNQFSHKSGNFSGYNPMHLLKMRNSLRNGTFKQHHPLERQNLSHAIYQARHQVFPVAARKTRKNRRKSSRKSRR